MFESSSPLNRTRLLLIFKATLVVVNVLVVRLLLDIAPDAVRLLLDIAPVVTVLLVIAPDAVSVPTDIALNILVDKPIIR